MSFCIGRCIYGFLYHFICVWRSDHHLLQYLHFQFTVTGIMAGGITIILDSWYVLLSLALESGPLSFAVL